MKKTEKVTVPRFVQMKSRGEKIACLTAYDWLFALLLDQSGIDLILVGDSAAMVYAGHDTTLPITLEQMIYHTQCVARGVKKALLISDMPFLSFQVNPDEALRNAGRLLKEGGAEGVKIEGGEPMAETIKKITEMGIPVMGHLGLTPQAIKSFGGYRVRGRDEKEAVILKNDAIILQEAGAFAIVLEKIPAVLAKEITESIDIPTIGIGAGSQCDGQILVTHDLLGLFEEFKPKFVRQYAEVAQTLRKAFTDYIRDVKNNSFPSIEESF
jgi:3-methyl-2-oxobutanoate hydroxymethyltransferase